MFDQTEWSCLPRRRRPWHRQRRRLQKYVRESFWFYCKASKRTGNVFSWNQPSWLIILHGVERSYKLIYFSVESFCHGWSVPLCCWMFQWMNYDHSYSWLSSFYKGSGSQLLQTPQGWRRGGHARHATSLFCTNMRTTEIVCSRPHPPQYHYCVLTTGHVKRILILFSLNNWYLISLGN